ncbi:hypothetical protein TTHERM_00427420 (macronuclear) [Tetrahymena thermophila SB210]|uniref:Uncharacterized protein n=1 Tax=Tetrahymena thermophila (strain SB210) TaxID=312017 RepID=Q23AB6_TETTS|nr:hypothetical protein TTHERM_00427420 [Tetrahymena thermophila SB210]EAR93576.3 hypothetical protein TTHERM_00427420 [Tetrahymena thermophila SB210]|eukprot:XP_001013821.3 hypothetical protein TTHERM_00427420 [Tetrahymena thermophila SB210]
MDREDFTVYGIQNPKEFQGYIKLQDLEALCCQYLEVQPMYKAIKEIYETNYNEDEPIQPTQKLDAQHVFQIIRSAKFIERTPRFLNNMYTSQSVKIIEASIIIFIRNLLKLNEIRDAMLIFVLKEMEHQTIGLPLNEEVITGLLWKINKTISNDILKEWIKRCNDIIQYKGVIQVHEFLYLVCNTINRHEYIEKIPKIQMDIERDKFGIFKIEAAQASTQKNPDEKIQNYMKYQYNMEKMIFDGRTLQKKDEYYQQKRKNKMDQIMKSDDNFQQEFRKMLRDQELYEEIKIRLRNANQLINQAKINGRLYQDAQGETEESDYELESERQQNQQIPVNIQDKKLSKIELVQQSSTYQKKQMHRPQSAFITQVKQEVNLHRQMNKDLNYQSQIKIEEKQFANTAINFNSLRPSSALNKFPIASNQKLRPQTAVKQTSNNINQMRQGLKSATSNATSSKFFGNTISTNANSRPQSNSLAKTQSFTSFHKRMLLSSAKQYKKKDLNIMSASQNPDTIQVLQNLDEELDFWEDRQNINQTNQNKIFVPFGNVNKKNYTINLPWSSQYTSNY